MSAKLNLAYVFGVMGLGFVLCLLVMLVLEAASG
jgi:hypothetical protein